MLNIYQVTNKQSGKSYVAKSTKDVGAFTVALQKAADEFKAPKTPAKQGKKLLLADLKEQGLDGFDVVSLGSFDNPLLALKLEQEKIAALGSCVVGGYNARPGGELYADYSVSLTLEEVKKYAAEL